MTMEDVFCEIPIEQLCTKVTTGATPLRSRSDFYDGGTVDWYKTGELKDWYLDPAEERITQRAFEETSVKLFPSNTVLMAMYGDGKTITSLGMLRNPAATNQACSAMLVDEHKCDARYFFYALKARRHLLLKLASGGAQRNLSGKLIKEFKLPVPPIPAQVRIAGILSAYDELIENNQRRIKILETMARALYREWFVHFRFPAHEKIPLVSTSFGDIPQGWEVKRAPQCVDINPRVAVSREGEKAFVPMGCLSNESMLISDVETREGNSGAKFQNGDTLFARITPCLENGKTGFVQFLPDAQSVAFGSTEFIVLRSRTLTPEFVYLLARSEEFRGVAIKSMSGASGRQRVQERCFDDFQIAQPPSTLLSRFSTIVAPSFRLIYKLHLQIQNLRRTRDLLLPRLLSGQVALQIDEIEQQLAKIQVESLKPTPAPVVSIPTPRKRANEPAPLQVAEATPPDYVNRKPPDIEETDRNDVLCAIRTLFGDGVKRVRATAVRDLAHALGYQRTGSRIQEVLDTNFLTAVRRGILVNEGGAYSLGFRSLAECTRESTKKDFESAIGRGWISRDDAVRAFARWLGFARVGKAIDDTVRSLINGLIREDRLKTDGLELIRRR